MTTAVRWEWRTFDGDFGDAEARLREQPETVETVRDIYVVCDMSAGEARIRNDVLEVSLPQRTIEGVNLWKTVLRAPFPIEALTVARTFGYLEIRPSGTDRDTYSVEQFLSEIVAPHHALTQVEVGRVRHTFALDGCIGDISDVTINGVPTRTLGIQGDNQAQIVNAVRTFGLNGRASLSFVAAIKRHLAPT